MKILDYDVVVAGGGSAGTAAALAASRAGAKTMLVERNGAFGGEAVNSWVSAYCGFYTKGKNPQQIIYGVGEEVLERMRAYGQDTSYTVNPTTGNASIRFRPEYIKLVFDDLLESSDIDYRLYTNVIAAKAEGNHLVSVTIQDDEETTEVRAKAFVDCTGSGNLIHLAGLKTLWGNDQGEVQQASLSCLIAGTEPKEFPMECLTKAIQEGKKNNIPYLDKEKGLIVKIPSDTYGYMTIPSINLTGLDGRTMTKGMMELRRKAVSYTKTLKEYGDDFKNIELVATAPVIGERETRRMIGRDTITGEQILRCEKNPSHTIGRGGWPAEIHGSKDYKFIQIKENDYYDIPLEALESKDLNNLFAGGRNISCDSFAMASVRVMGTSFATGQGAGAAAAVYASDGDAEVSKVQNILRSQNALL